MRAIAYFCALLTIAYMLAGCASAPKPTAPDRVRVTTDISCRLMRPRTWSTADTFESIEYRRQDNAAACTCPQHKAKQECLALSKPAH
jgi:hypothetical protein